MSVSVLAEIYFGIVPEFESAGNQLSSDLTFGEEQVRRYATRDFYDSWGRFYQAGLLDAPRLAQQLDDLYFGIETSSPVRVQLSNAQGEWDVLAQEKDLRTAWLVLKYQDDDSGISFQWRGRVVQYSITATEANLRAEMRDDESLDVELPRDTIGLEDFASTARDAGEAIPIPIGHTWGQPCPNVQYDTGYDEYDYLIGYGPIEGLQEDAANGLGVKRDGVLVDPSEYTLFDGTQDTPYGGYAVIRFTEAQEDYAGKRHKITADVKGLLMGDSTAERNFANVLRHLLTNTTWGVGDKIDTTTFRQAESDLPTTGYLCDGAIVSKESARDIINNLLFPMRARLEKDYAGYWRVYVDKAKSSVASFGDNDGYWDNCELQEISATPLDQAYKTITVKYGKEDIPQMVNEEQGLYKLSYTARSYGVDKTFERKCRFFKEHVTAKKVLSYIANRSIYSDRKARIRCGLKARQRQAGEVITLYAPGRGINGKNYEIEAVRKNGLSEYTLDLRDYSDSIYTDLSLSSPTEIVRSTDQRSGPAILEQYANTVIRYSADPPPHYPGLLWWETDVSPNKVYRSDGETWQFMGSPDALGLINAPAQAGADVTGDHPDDVIFRQSSAPPHKKGRFWKDTDTGDFYRSNGSSWESIGAEDALRLINAPAESGADQTSNHPDSVIFYGTSAPSHRVGRLWCDTGSTPQKIYRSDGSNWNLVGTRDDDIRSSNDSSLINGDKNEPGTIISTEEVPSNLRAEIDQDPESIDFGEEVTVFNGSTGDYDSGARIDVIIKGNYSINDAYLHLFMECTNSDEGSQSFYLYDGDLYKGATYSAVFTGIPSNTSFTLSYTWYCVEKTAGACDGAAFTVDHIAKGFTQVVTKNK
jgi:hypothetical protein